VTSVGEKEEKENTIQPPFLCFSHLQDLVKKSAKLIMCCYWHEFEQSILKLFPYNVAVNLNMFGAFMKDRIGCNMHGTLIVTI